MAKDGETCPGHPHILRSSPTCQEKLDKARQKGGEETDVTASAKDVAEPKTDVGDVKTDVTAPKKDEKESKGIADPSKDGKKPKMDVTGAGSRGGAPMTDREVADFTGRAVLRSAACDGGQRAPTEKECLAATHAAHAARAGRNSHRPKETLKRVNARAVPAGCTYSHASRMAVFNTNKAGGCSP